MSDNELRAMDEIVEAVAKREGQRDPGAAKDGGKEP